jgi:hypothetical protein
MKQGDQKKKVLLAAAALAGVSLAAGPANAGLVSALQANPATDIEFKFTAGTTNENTWGGTNENTWGVGKLTNVINTGSGNPIWGAGDDDEEITFILYGIADAQTSGTPPNVNIWSVGATGGDGDGLIHIDFYVDSFAASDTDFGVDGPADRTAFDKSGDWTDGTLLMQWVLDTGAVADLGNGGFDESLAALFQQVESASLPTRGDGNFFASCVSGNLICSLLDSNGFTTNSGFQSDLEGQFTLEAGGRGLWDGDVNDPVEGEVTVPMPEPASLTLFGIGLIGLGMAGRLQRRRRAA